MVRIRPPGPVLPPALETTAQALSLHGQNKQDVVDMLGLGDDLAHDRGAHPGAGLEARSEPFCSGAIDAARRVGPRYDALQKRCRPHEGKSGGFRSIVLFRSGEKSFFVYGFPKSARDNVRKDELQGFKELAEEMLPYDDAALEKAVGSGALIEASIRSDSKARQRAGRSRRREVVGT